MGMQGYFHMVPGVPSPCSVCTGSAGAGHSWARSCCWCWVQSGEAPGPWCWWFSSTPEKEKCQTPKLLLWVSLGVTRNLLVAAVCNQEILSACAVMLQPWIIAAHGCENNLGGYVRWKLLNREKQKPLCSCLQLLNSLLILYKRPWAEIISASLRLEISQISMASAALGSSTSNFQSLISTHGQLRDKTHGHLTLCRETLIYCELDPKII